MANSTVMIDIGADETLFRRHLATHVDAIGPIQSLHRISMRDQSWVDPAKLLDTIRSLSNDWEFFRFYKSTRQGGSIESRYAISAGLGVITGITVGEYYRLTLAPLDHYTKNQASYREKAEQARADDRIWQQTNAFNRWLEVGSPGRRRDLQAEGRSIQKSLRRAKLTAMLASITIGELSADDLFLSKRDQFLTRTPEGMGLLQEKMKLHASLGELTFASLGDRNAILFIAPDSEGFEDRVARELQRAAPPHYDPALASGAFAYPDAESFTQATFAKRREKIIRTIVEPHIGQLRHPIQIGEEQDLALAL